MLIDFGHFWPDRRPYQDLVLKKLRPGDISTHMYKADVPLFDGHGKLLPYLAEARQRGVKFDLGHGLGNFLFRIVVPAVRQGWVPDCISTDLHVDSMNQAAKSLTNLMSKMLAVGFSLEDVIAMTTIKPATMMKHPRTGQLERWGGGGRGRAEPAERGFWVPGHPQRAHRRKAEAGVRANASGREGCLGFERSGR